MMSPHCLMNIHLRCVLVFFFYVKKMVNVGM